MSSIIQIHWLQTSYLQKGIMLINIFSVQTFFYCGFKNLSLLHDYLIRTLPLFAWQRGESESWWRSLASILCCNEPAHKHKRLISDTGG